MVVKFSRAERLFRCDQYYPPSGTIRHIALLSAELFLNEVFTVSAALNEINFATSKPFQTGARVRVTSSSTLPTPLTASVDYFIIRVSPTSFKLAQTIADAIVGTEVNIVDSGVGTLTLNEQALLEDDPIAVLVSKEIAAFPGYLTRFAVTDPGLALIVNGKPEKSFNFNVVNSGTGPITIGHLLVLRGGSTAIGNVTGEVGLESLSSPLVLAVGDTKSLTYVMQTN